jgi:hypothetical protein
LDQASIAFLVQHGRVDNIELHLNCDIRSIAAATCDGVVAIACDDSVRRKKAAVRAGSDDIVAIPAGDAGGGASTSAVVPGRDGVVPITDRDALVRAADDTVIAISKRKAHTSPAA